MSVLIFKLKTALKYASSKIVCFFFNRLVMFERCLNQGTLSEVGKSNRGKLWSGEKKENAQENR